MEHEYYTSRRKDDTRAWVPVVVVVALLAATFAGVFLAFRDDGPAESEGSLPSVAFRPATTTTTLPATVATSSVVLPTPPRVTAPPPLLPQRSEGEPDTAPQEPRAALRDLAEERDATVVSDVVSAGSERFAMLVRSGDGELYRWSGSEWTREDLVSGPAAISDVETVDVTGDGSTDFLLTLVGLRAEGGVYGRSTFGFEVLPFNTNDGQVDWVDDLHLDLGRLISDVDVNGDATRVEWTWTGQQFEVVG